MLWIDLTLWHFSQPVPFIVTLTVPGSKCPIAASACSIVEFLTSTAGNRFSPVYGFVMLSSIVSDISF